MSCVYTAFRRAVVLPPSKFFPLASWTFASVALLHAASAASASSLGACAAFTAVMVWPSALPATTKAAAKPSACSVSFLVENDIFFSR